MKDIRWIDVGDESKENIKFNKPSNLFIAAGVGYFALDQLTRAVYNDAPISLYQSVKLLCGSLVAAGLVMKLVAGNLRNKNASIGKKYSICLSRSFI